MWWIWEGLEVRSSQPPQGMFLFEEGVLSSEVCWEFAPIGLKQASKPLQSPGPLPALTVPSPFAKTP